MSFLYPPSEEQCDILKSFKSGYNIIVDAVAGSGKTTTILHLAKDNPEKTFLVLTYNSRLKTETREKVESLKLSNIEIHTYHSLGLKYYINECRNDIHLCNILKYNHPLKNKKNLLIFDCIVIDEAQDIKPILYIILCKFLNDLRNNTIQIITLGDRYQCIYDYSGANADFRYLTFASKIYNSSNEWKNHSLQTSYRLTNNIGNFINNCVLNYPRIKTVHTSDIKVQYVVGNPFESIPKYFANQVVFLLQNGYNPDDIFILAPTIRGTSNSPIKKLENELVIKGIPCYVSNSDNEDLKETLMNGKVVFSSIHQSKGLERKIVILMNFSTSYFYCMSKKVDLICPNLIYVGLTRAKERLYLEGEGYNSYNLPFVNHTNFGNFTETIVLNGYNIKKNTLTDETLNELKNHFNLTPKKFKRRVTDLIRFLPNEILEQCIELIGMKEINKKEEDYEIQLIIPTTDGKNESVSELNGIAIPAIYESQLFNECSIQKVLHDLISNDKPIPEYIRPWIHIIQNKPDNNTDFLKLANLYSTYVSEYIHKLFQIPQYDWLSNTDVNNLLNILKKHINIDKNPMFEYNIEYEYEYNNCNVHIYGSIDVLTDNDLWELKCVSEITYEHFIQLALYAWLWQEKYYNEKGLRDFKILNFRTGQIYRITNINNLKYVIDIILAHNFSIQTDLTDECFLDKCREDIKNINKSNQQSILTFFKIT